MKSKLLVAFMLGWWASHTLTDVVNYYFEEDYKIKLREARGKAMADAVGYMVGRK